VIPLGAQPVLSLAASGEPQIGLLDEDGKTLVGVGISPDLGQGINIFDREGKEMIVVAISPTGKQVIGSFPTREET
jgi:hypothetical protein